MKVVVLFLLGGCLLFFIVDLFIKLYTWQSRIHIGKYSTYEEWEERISNISEKWLLKTPKVKVTDNTRLILIDILKGNYSKNTIQYWQQAAILLGLNKKNKLNQEQVNKFLSFYLNEEGGWKTIPKEIDAAILSYAVMEYDTENKYKKSYDSIIELIEEHKGNDGTIVYRKHMKNYRYVDTIGFICPFLTRYGVKFNKEAYVELAFKQIVSYRKHGFLNNQVIPYHAYDEINGYPLGLCGWGRGIGWYALGLIDMWRELPDNHLYKQQLSIYVIELAQQIIKLQHESGGWGWISTRIESRDDSSATAIFLWFLINAKVLDELSETCDESIQKSISYLKSVTRRDGTIDFSQGDTKDIGVYSNLFEILPFTQGLTCRTVNVFLK
ncbi:glycoside hydrolase family 88 protein [Turicibacter sanguinis]|uniref:glycoside hydrolase family 88 protein n=1 Tax=Turicibacter sanguinis TaxID=154288 RepID=UPI0018A92C47|nr:glycoside hydrolase family 88 protein [Turicibacter sanguinis]MDB8558408.1 glycoside hydrolase family 88 protein [Turicibacter sanguinis]MDB8561204.1 glycoside hydrolase family 88 protein [Turicibacter sanguinis]